MRIESDWLTEDPARNYVLGAAAVSALHELLEAANPGPRPRAFTITGPFGTGKSALALFLADLLAGPDGRRQRASRLGLAHGIDANLPEAFLPVLVTCQPQRLEGLLSEAFESAIRRYGMEGPGTLPNLVEQAERAGFGGVLLVLDELGKVLEFAAANADRAGVFHLQEIAEFAARSTLPVIVVGILHQSFGGYSEMLDSSARAEWTKVEGRFRNIVFLPAEATLAHLIAESIGSKVMDADAESVASEVRGIADMWPSALSESAFVDLCRRSYPLHPMTVAALPILMRRFGQNERSLFAFLVERGLLSVQSGAQGSVRIADLFDHVSDWIGHGSRSGLLVRRWRLARELIGTRALDEEERDVLRTVALLNVLGKFAPFRASTEVVGLALPGTDAQKVLGRLRERSMIVHRRHLGSWVLWEGSDVNLDDLLDRALAEVAGRVDLAATLAKVGAVSGPLAQRHFEQTGTLRWLKPVVVTDVESAERIQNADPTNGVLIVALGANPSVQTRLEDWARTLDKPEVVVAVVHRAPGFRNTAEEYEAVAKVERDTPELRGDRVARDELSARMADLSARLSDEAERLLDPSGPDGCVFYHRGQECAVENRRDLTRLVSTVFDELFPHSPILRNELINRRSLSSAAAAARRDLLEAMLERTREPRLGYTNGYPPDRAMYESMLLETGLHRVLDRGVWGFGAPDAPDRCGMAALWSRTCELLFGEFPNPIRVSDLAAELAGPPFGLLDGPFPLFLCAFMLAHGDEMALYREGSFLPEMTIAHWELILRRPELFAVAGCRQMGARARALELVCGRLGVVPAALMPAVRFVIKAVDKLPPRAKATRDVSERAMQARSAALAARSPDAFFFHDLPRALGLHPLGEQDDPVAADEFLLRLRAVLNELDQVVPRTREWARGALARASGFPADDEGFEALRRLAGLVHDRLDDPKARNLCARLSAPDREAAEIGSLSLVAMRPVESWTDDDRDAFEARARALCAELRQEGARLGATYDKNAEISDLKLEERIYNEFQSVGDRAALLRVLRRVLRRIEREAN